MPGLSAMLHATARRLGFSVYRLAGYEREVGPVTWATISAVKPFTLTSKQRITGLVESVRYVTENRIPGAIVECGVWRGGSVMAAARTLLELGDTSRQIILFDTFSGMTPPEDVDTQVGTHRPASELLTEHAQDRTSRGSVWAEASLEDVKQNVLSTGYPEDKFTFVRGPVEETLPAAAPDSIAILRLDTDWYQSTKHELEHLYHLVTSRGVVIIDDYGSWEGARRAVDEFFDQQEFKPLMMRLDTGRLIVVP